MAGWLSQGDFVVMDGLHWQTLRSYGSLPTLIVVRSWLPQNVVMTRNVFLKGDQPN